MGPVALDDPLAVRAGDPGGMLGLVAALGRHLRAGYAAGREAAYLPSSAGVRGVAVCGMGGSGMTGDALHGLFAARLGFPVTVVKGYVPPEHCGRDTVVLAVSFSGNTEETLAAYAQALGRGCRVVAVSAGGELASASASDGVPHVPVPAGIGAPRAGFGYLVGAAIGVLDAMALLPRMEDGVRETAALLDRLAERWGPDRSPEENPAKDLAGWLLGRTPLVWGFEGIAAAAALRWKCQLNENAKVPAFSAAFPELDHNEVEGWTADSSGAYRAVVLRHRGEDQRAPARIQATLGLVGQAGLESREVSSEGATPLEELFSLVMLGDFASTYLAILRGVDPLPVPALTSLKEALRR